MKTRIRIAIITLLLSLSANSFAQPLIEQGVTHTFYGRVNRWTLSRATLKKELNLMKDCGVAGYMIELASWAPHTQQPWTEEWIEMVRKEYHYLLKECRKRDLWLFVSIVNDNMGKGKYSDTGPALEKVYNYALQLANIVKHHGAKGVIIQPVAETNTEAGMRFEKDCLQLLKEFTLVYNGDYGSPKETPAEYDFRAIHPSHITSNVPSDAFIISDHGLIIRELSINDDVESQGDPKKVKDWRDRLSAQGVPIVGYYAFKYEEFDPDTIRALGTK